MRRERDEDRAVLGQIAPPQPVPVLGQDDDGPPFRRFVGERRELSGVGDFLLGDPGKRNELGRLPVSERDRSRLVEQQRVHVAGRLDGTARHRQHVALNESIHARDAYRRQQAADRRRDEADEQRDEDEH